MVCLSGVRGWETVPIIVMWCLGVLGLAKALFASFPMVEVQFWFARWQAPKRQRVQQLNWEVNNRAHFDLGLLMQSKQAGKNSKKPEFKRLTQEEFAQREAELKSLMKTSLPMRAFQYFQHCWACQTFWAAVILCLVCGHPTGFVDGFVTCLAYSSVCVLASSIKASGGSGKSCPSGNCGK